jgi:hypothetical protein
MNKRFYFELTIGVIGLIAVLVFGMPGFAAFALFAFFPLFSRKRADEREYQLFYRAGNMTAALTFIACVFIYFVSDLRINGHLIGDLWLFLVCFSFLVAHGISGLIIFQRN